MLRIAFAGVAMQLVQVIGLLLAGGILLLWVCGRCGAVGISTIEHSIQVRLVQNDEAGLSKLTG